MITYRDTETNAIECIGTLDEILPIHKAVRRKWGMSNVRECYSNEWLYGIILDVKSHITEMSIADVIYGKIFLGAEEHDLCDYSTSAERKCDRNKSHFVCYGIDNRYEIWEKKGHMFRKYSKGNICKCLPEESWLAEKLYIDKRYNRH